jgi:hypothetical protein
VELAELLAELVRRGSTSRTHISAARLIRRGLRFSTADPLSFTLALTASLSLSLWKSTAYTLVSVSSSVTLTLSSLLATPWDFFTRKRSPDIYR